MQQWVSGVILKSADRLLLTAARTVWDSGAQCVQAGGVLWCDMKRRRPLIDIDKWRTRVVGGENSALCGQKQRHRE